MDNIGIASVAGILVICYLVGLFVKATKLDNKWIPVIVGAVGGALGVVGFYFMVDYPAQDIITAIAVGVVSGIGATGADQVFKQLRGERND